MGLHRRGIAASLLASLCVAPARLGAQRPASGRLSAIAADGTLRVGLYHFNPLLVSRGARTGQFEGLGPDIAIALARWAGVAGPELRPFTALQAIAGCVVEGPCSAIFIATDAEIAPLLAFSPTLIEADNTYLVRAEAPFATAAEVDRPGASVAVFTGSAADTHLSRLLRHATIRRTTEGRQRVEWLRTGEVDAIADNAETLRALFAPQVEGSRILPGSFSMLAMAMATARGNAAGAAILREFGDHALRSGVVSESVTRWGVRARSAAAPA